MYLEIRCIDKTRKLEPVFEEMRYTLYDVDSIDQIIIAGVKKQNLNEIPAIIKILNEVETYLIKQGALDGIKDYKIIIASRCINIFSTKACIKRLFEKGDYETLDVMYKDGVYDYEKEIIEMALEYGQKERYPKPKYFFPEIKLEELPF